MKGIPILSVDIIEVRDNFRPPFWGNFFAFTVVNIIMIIAKYSFKGFNKISLKHLLFLAVSICLIIISTARVDLIYAFIVSVIIFIRIREKINPYFNIKRVLVIVSLIVLFFSFVFQKIGDLRGINQDAITYVDASPTVSTFLAYGGPTAIKNFQRVVEKEVVIPNTNGLFILRPILWYIGFRHLVDLENNFIGPNTSTWLYEYYCDFGFFGIIFILFSWIYFCKSLPK